MHSSLTKGNSNGIEFIKAKKNWVLHGFLPIFACCGSAADKAAQCTHNQIESNQNGKYFEIYF